MSDCNAKDEHYRLLQAGLDHIDQGITVFDCELNLVGWNRRFFELLEFPPELAQPGTHFSEFMRYNAARGEYGPGDVDQLVAERVRAAADFTPHYIERTRPNGQIIAVRGEPLPGTGFVTVYTDITAERRRERQIQEEMGELESRLRLITDAVPALIAYVDRHCRFQFANRGYAEWFGYTKQGIIGRTCREVQGDKLYGFIQPYLARALTGEKVSYEYTHRLGDGSTVFARSTLVPEINEQGEVQGLFVLSVDVTEHKKAEAALIQAQKMEAVGQLTGGLAHDFNNLLTIVIGNLSAMRDRPEAAPLADLLDPALQAARRGAELTRRLLAFSKRQELAPATVEIDGLIANMVGLLRRSLSRQVEIVLATGGDPLFALVDPHQLENALLNLALNARDAMPAGGRLRIATTAVDLDQASGYDAPVLPGTYVQITVEDNGCGMDAETQARAFEPFFTRKEFGAGSGLGLSMVYGFVKQSGGYVRLASTPEVGTQVTILLPMMPATAIEKPAATEPVARRHGDSRLVLVVEDDRDVRAVIRRQLTGLGHMVIEADNGTEAARLLDTLPDLDVLVSDVIMPGGMNGVALAIYARERRPDLKIVLISGFADTAEHDGAAGFPLLRKPFTADQLAALIAE